MISDELKATEAGKAKLQTKLKEKEGVVNEKSNVGSPREEVRG